MSVFCCDLFLFYVRYFCFLSFTISFPCLSISRFSASRYLVSLPLAISLFCLSLSRFSASRNLVSLPFAISLFCLSLSRFSASRYLVSLLFDISILRSVDISVSQYPAFSFSLTHSLILSFFHSFIFLVMYLFPCLYIFFVFYALFSLLYQTWVQRYELFFIYASLCAFFLFFLLFLNTPSSLSTSTSSRPPRPLLLSLPSVWRASVYIYAGCYPASPPPFPFQSLSVFSFQFSVFSSSPVPSSFTPNRIRNIYFLALFHG